MRPDSWVGRLVLTITRRTPAYQAVGVRGISRFSRLPRPVPRARGRATSAEDRRFIYEVAETVVRLVAPRELTAFPAVSSAYFAGPRRTPARTRGRSRLAPGGEVVDRWTPVILVAVAEIKQYLAKDPDLSRISRLSHLSRLGPEVGSGPVLEVRDEARAAVRRIVAEAVRRSGLADDAADRISGALIGTGDDEARTER